jgi:hypothetical protein
MTDDGEMIPCYRKDEHRAHQTMYIAGPGKRPVPAWCPGRESWAAEVTHDTRPTPSQVPPEQGE